MTDWFVSRHPGAVDWARSRGITADRWVDHLNTTEVAQGDCVMGTLSMEAAAQVCERGARFFALTMALPPAQRGIELARHDLNRLNCTLKEYTVQALQGDRP